MSQGKSSSSLLHGMKLPAGLLSAQFLTAERAKLTRKTPAVAAPAVATPASQVSVTRVSMARFAGTLLALGSAAALLFIQPASLRGKGISLTTLLFGAPHAAVTLTAPHPSPNTARVPSARPSVVPPAPVSKPATAESAQELLAIVGKY